MCLGEIVEVCSSSVIALSSLDSDEMTDLGRTVCKYGKPFKYKLALTNCGNCD